MNTKKITRVEVIDDHGRSYVAQGVHDLRLELQDDERTLKIFLSATGVPGYNWTTGEVYADEK